MQDVGCEGASSCWTTVNEKQGLDPNVAPTRVSMEISRDLIGIDINQPSLCCWTRRAES